MNPRTADSNYQALARDFKVEDLVVPYGASRDFAGRVVAVYPAIGMVEVQFPHGNKRYPVEDVQRLDSEGNPTGSEHDTVPGGAETVSVPNGPGVAKRAADPARVGRAFVKQAIYWASRDRKYRASLLEQESGEYLCPECKDVPLRRTSYRREEGRSIRILGCPKCLFLIRPDDIEGCHHTPVDVVPTQEM